MRFREGNDGEAELLYRRSLAIQRKLFGNESMEITDSLVGLGTYLRNTKPDEAEALCREALAICRKLRGDESLEVANAAYGLGLVLTDRHKYAEAETAHREALAIRRKMFPHLHNDLAGSVF